MTTSNTDDWVPAAATRNTGRGNSTAAQRSWTSCSRPKMTWFWMRNRCCTRSWTQEPQAGSTLGSMGGRVVEGVPVPGMVVGGWSVVVEVVVVLLVTLGDVEVVVLPPTTGQRLRSSG